MDALDLNRIDWDGVPGRLRDAMGRRGWSQRRFAQAAGVTLPAVSKWLKGGRISPERWSGVATAAGLTVPELLGADRPGEPRLRDHEAESLLGRLAALSDRRLDQAVPDLMQVLREAQELVQARDS